MANAAKYVKVYYKAYANVRLNVIPPLEKIEKDETYEDRLAYVGYIFMILIDVTAVITMI